MIGVLLFIQNCFVDLEFYRMVLNITAFYKHIYLRNLTFQGLLGFYFCLLIAGVFGLHLNVTLMGL